MARFWAWVKAITGGVASAFAGLFAIYGTSLSAYLPPLLDPIKHRSIAYITFLVLGSHGVWRSIAGWRVDMSAAKREEQQDFKEAAREVLVVLLRDLIQHGNLESYKLCVNVFLVEQHGRLHVQRMVAHIRLGDPRPNGIQWTQGKGVIGMCWHTGLDQQLNLLSFYAPHAKKKEKAWNDLPPDARMELDWHEYQKVRDVHYVAASAIVDDDGKYVGCVSVDGPIQLEASYANWSQDLKDAANGVARVLPKLKR